VCAHGSDLAPLGIDEHREFLTTPPWLVIVFQMTHTDDGGQVYYLKELVGRACGLFRAAAQLGGLAMFRHTPSRWRSSVRISAAFGTRGCSC
jgi:hypothetical protein